MRLTAAQRTTALAVLCWAISLMLPAVDLGLATGYGWQFLAQGWRGLPQFNIGGLSWLANPLLLISCCSVLFWRGEHAHWLACAALAAALTSFLFNALGGASGRFIIRGYEVGFYLWLLSIVMQVISTTRQRRKMRAQSG